MVERPRLLGKKMLHFVVSLTVLASDMITPQYFDILSAGARQVRRIYCLRRFYPIIQNDKNYWLLQLQANLNSLNVFYSQKLKNYSELIRFLGTV